MLPARLENLIVDDMTPKQVRHVKAVTAARAQGRMAQIYAQIRADFQLVPPLTLFSPAPDLLAGVWSVWRESQFALGKVPRPLTEAVAAAVSSINACPYCVDAHTGMLHAAADHDLVTAIIEENSPAIRDTRKRDIVEWALATRSPGEAILDTPPFSAYEAPEIIGTAVVYHFVNRMVGVFLGDSPLPVPRGRGPLRRMAVKIFGATVGKSLLRRAPEPGASLAFIPDADVPRDMSWAVPNRHVASAFAGFAALTDQAGQKTIPQAVRERVHQHIKVWTGEDMPLGRGWLETAIDDLSASDQAIARLLLLTALAPYQVGDDDIAAFRTCRPGDEALIAATTWASFTAARHISHWLSAGH